MRITFLSPPPNLSGGERVIAIYARELIKLGYDVQIVCSRKDTPSLKSRVKRIVSTRRLLEPPPPPSHYENYGVPFRFVEHNGGFLDSDLPDADIVIATFWRTVLSLSQIGPDKGKWVYLIQHDEAIFHGSEAIATYDMPMTHVYVSEWIANRIRHRHPNCIGETIPNAVDVEAFEQGRREMPTSPTFGMMWSAADFKNSQLAIDAVTEARRRGVQCNLIAFSARRPPAETLAAFQDFAYCPSPEKISEIYGSCTAWLFSSDEEGFGLPILESMATGTPVIGTRTGAAPELIGAGGGTLVPLRDVDAMADSIVQYCRLSPDEWSRQSKVAYRTACSHTWGDAAKQLESVLLRTVGGES